MNFTINTALSIIGLPTEKKKFKKYLVDTRNLDINKMECEVKNWHSCFEDLHMAVFN